MSRLLPAFPATRASSILGVVSVVAALTMSTALTACGSSTAEPASPGAGSVAATTASAGSSMPGMTSHGTTTAATAGTPVAGNTVMIQNFAFVAPSIIVRVGTTVTWTNADEDPHTVTATDGSFRSPTMINGARFSHTFTTTGTFPYMCTIHPFMHATVVVTR